MRVAENKVRIEGTLLETNLEKISFTKKDGKSVDAIRGHYIVRVPLATGVNEIPVQVFAPKYTNAGKENPAYRDALKVMEDFTSVAACGGEENATRVRITSGKITMSEYYNSESKLVSIPRIASSFVNSVRKEECKPEASFTVEMVIAAMGPEVNAEGEETGRYKIKGIVPKYGGGVEVVDFYCANENVANSIAEYWQTNETVHAAGRLNFTTSTVVKTQALDFGEAVERTYTIKTSELLITGGSQTPLEGEFAFDLNDIQEALAMRKADLEARKDKDMNRTKQRKAPAKESSNGTLDLGF